MIDESFGAACITYVAQSVHKNLGNAIEKLRSREETNAKGIGFLMAKSDEQVNAVDRHLNAASIIEDWIRASGYDAAIWTKLQSNFQQKTGKAFSVEEALQYLETLNRSALEIALNYIRRAPLEIGTPVRSAVNLRWPQGVSNITSKP